MLAVWGVSELARGWRYRVVALSSAASTAVVLCMVLTRQQLGHWKDTEALFRHTLEVTENNWLAHNNLGCVLDNQGQTDEAIRQYQEAILFKPSYAETHNDLGYLWAEHGENLDQARAMIERAVQIEPKNAAFKDSMGWPPRRKLTFLKQTRCLPGL